MNYYLQVWKKYAVFSGRARRSEYWYFSMFNFIFSFMVGFACGFFKIPFVNALFSLATLIPTIAVGVRRMHDTGRSGWYLIVPIYNLVLLFTEGVQGDNHYGPDPKGGGKPPQVHSVTDMHPKEEKQKQAA